MKVLVYAPLAVLGHHFETDLEIIQDHLIAGDQVTVIKCEGQLRKIDFVSCRGLLRCSLCKSRFEEGIKTLNNAQKLTVRTLPKLNATAEAIDNLDLTNQENIYSYKWLGVDVGAAYMSTLISDIRDPQPNLKKFRNKTAENMKLLTDLAKKTNLLLEEEKPDRVYFFNGRFSIYRAFVRLCQQKKIEFFVHERGGHDTLYTITKNNMPHDLETRIEEIEEKWTKSNKSAGEKKEIGENWYRERAAGGGAGWYSFTTDQKTRQLPADWIESKKNISIYVTSEDEFAAIAGWKLEFYQSQYEGVKKILESFKDNSEFQFYVRMHPNLKGLDNKEIRNFKQLNQEYSNCTVLYPESTISTYTLMRSSNKTLSFGSTTSIEGAYWGIPSILIGKAFYMNLGSVYICYSHEEVIKVLMDENLVPLPKDGAVKYGFWASMMGEKFKYYVPLSLTTGRFNNHVITGRTLYLIVNYLSILANDIKKILRGELGLLHLKEKIRAKFIGFSKRHDSH